MDDNNKKKAIRRLATVFFAITLSLFTLLGFLFPLRPDTSELEKRELTAFPVFSVAQLINGNYFSDITLWFSDTFPFRDILVEMSNAFGGILGTDAVKQGFNEGVTGDEIPDAPTTNPAFAETTVLSTETTAADIPEMTTVPEETTMPVTEVVTTTQEVTATQTEASTISPEGQQMGNIFVYGNAGYEYYNFVQKTADNYITAVNTAAQMLNGRARVYDMIIPTSIDITLDKNIRARLSVSDQQKAIAYMYGSLGAGITTVNIYDTLVNHSDEYIYFRTDHHWTGLGAYYAYREFCAAKGITPLELNQYTLKSYDGFLGSFYNDSGMSPALGNSPDTVEAYYPPCNTRMTVTDKKGETAVRPMLYDASNSQAANKYSCFIFGDNPLSVIENTDKTDGERCLLVKESFGNAFAPYLSYHYKYVYVMDYRYCQQSVDELVSLYGITDVIFCNNISMTRSSTQVEELQKSLQ